MRDRLPVEADQLDRTRRRLREQVVSGADMNVEHYPLCIGDERGPGLQAAGAHRLLGGGDQDGAFAVVERQQARWAELRYPLTVGIDDRRVHPVERGATHETQYAHLASSTVVPIIVDGTNLIPLAIALCLLC